MARTFTNYVSSYLDGQLKHKGFYSIDNAEQFVRDELFHFVFDLGCQTIDGEFKRFPTYNEYTIKAKTR